MIDKKNLRDDKRAVSPVIGVILMVAITVILAAVIGAFVFGVDPTSGGGAPSVQLRATYDATGSTDLTLKHMGGNPINLGECTIKADGDSCTFSGNLTVGQSATTTAACGSAAAGDAVTVEVIHNPSQSYVLETVIAAL